MTVISYDIINEFSQLPPMVTGEALKALGPTGAIHHMKNRYHNVLPNEDTRFVIEGDPHYYFNANTLFGGAAVACQGPMQEDAESFWKMVWHSGADTIVMVTDCYAGRTELCFQYWSKGSEDYGEHRVILRDEESISCDPYPELTIWSRTFVLEYGGEERVVGHYQLEGWRDFGCVPPEVLAKFVRFVSSQHNGTTPLITHCSAGLGRTGTFLTAYMIYRKMQESGDRGYNVFQKASELRLQRNGTIQRLEQYQLIYDTISLL